MEIKKQGSEVIIEGNIKSIGDFQAIKKTLDEIVLHHKSLNIIVKDSISMSSSVIGYLTKLVYKENIAITLQIGNSELVTLLDDLSLSELLHVRSIG